MRLHRLTARYRRSFAGAVHLGVKVRTKPAADVKVQAGVAMECSQMRLAPTVCAEPKEHMWILMSNERVVLLPAAAEAGVCIDKRRKPFHPWPAKTKLFSVGMERKDDEQTDYLFGPDPGAQICPEFGMSA